MSADGLALDVLRHVEQGHVRFHPGAWGEHIGFAYRWGIPLPDCEVRVLWDMSADKQIVVRQGSRYYYPRSVVLTAKGEARLRVLQAKARNEVAS